MVMGLQQFDLARAHRERAQNKGLQLQNQMTQGSIDKNAMVSSLRNRLYSAEEPGGGLRAQGLVPDAPSAPDMDATSEDRPTQAAQPFDVADYAHNKVDQDIVRQLMSIDPVGTKQILEGLSKQDARELAETKRKNSFGAGLMIRLLDMPKEQRAMKYQEMLQAAKQQGIKTKNLPRFYDEQTEQVLMTQVQKALGLDKLAEMQRKNTLKKSDMVRVADGKGGITLRRAREGMKVGMKPGDKTRLQKHQELSARHPEGSKEQRQAEAQIAYDATRTGRTPEDVRLKETPTTEPPEQDPIGFDPESATGGSGFISRPVNWLSETFFGATAMQDAADGTTALKRMQRDMILVGTADVIGRPSNFTRMMEQGLGVEAQSIFQTDASAKRKLTDKSKSIGRELDRMGRVLKNPEAYSKKDISDTRMNKTYLEKLKSEIDVFVDGYGKSEKHLEDLPDDIQAILEKHKK